MEASSPTNGRAPEAKAKAAAKPLEFFNELEDSPMFKQQAVDLEQGRCLGSFPSLPFERQGRELAGFFALPL